MNERYLEALRMAYSSLIGKRVRVEFRYRDCQTTGTLTEVGVATIKVSTEVGVATIKVSDEIIPFDSVGSLWTAS